MPTVADEAAPMALRVFYTYAGGNANMPITRLSVKSSVRRRPVAIVTAGCGFAVMAADLPRDTVVISVDENPQRVKRRSLLSACLAQDGQAVAAVIREHLTFAVSHLDRVELADPDRLVIVAIGDSAPVGAAFRGPAKAKLLLGDPCFVPWPETGALDRSTPTTILRGSSAMGRAWITNVKPRRGLSEDPIARIEASTRPCQALPRTALPSNFATIEAPGEVTTTGRPKSLISAAHAAFRRAVG